MFSVISNAGEMMMRMTSLTMAAGLAALLACSDGGAVAAPKRPCLEDVKTLCGRTRDREKIRACLMEKQDQLSEGCRTKIKEMRGARNGAAIPAEKRPYGNDPKQISYVYPATNGSRPPLIAFIHGGGWIHGDPVNTVWNKPAHFTQDHAFASIGYRLSPQVSIEDEARDVAAAIGALRRDAEALGFDRDRIILMGHSAGAHLAALIATDSRYLGRDFDAVRGVVLLDGAGYDVAKVMQGRGIEQRIYARAWGKDEAEWARLSPITHAAAPNAPHWAILYVGSREQSGAQSEALATALRTGGAEAAVTAIPDTTHGRLNHELGTAGDYATGVVDAFLKTALGV